MIDGLHKFFLSFVSLIFSTTIFSAQYNYVSIEGLIEQRIGEGVVTVLYEKLGHTVTITALSGKEAEVAATSGKKDGEIMRIWAYGENNLTTKRVPTPYYSLETMGFVKGTSLQIESKEELEHYRIGLIPGVKHTDNITREINESKITNFSSTKEMMLALDANKIDIALTNTVDGYIVISDLGLKGIEKFKKPLAVLDLYHYVHESKSDIIPEINNLIIEMNKTNELSELIQKLETKVIYKIDI